MSPLEVGWPLLVLLVVLVAAAALVVRVGGVGTVRDPLVASARAGVQLAVVSLVIAGVLRSMVLTLAFLALMTGVAAATSYRRVTGRLGPGAAWLVLPVAAGVVPPVGAALLLGVLPLEPVAVLPVGGIVVGGTMTATTLAGTRVTERLVEQHGPFEAALALGLTEPQAVRFLGRPAAGLALVPGLDQTRTVGLVTLPGAFVGVLLGGGSAVDAGAAQLLVLVGLLYAQAVAVAITVELVARGRLVGRAAAR
ncbi:ABC transporter permease [Nocardioides sp. CFH 31398]|uniref:ABC transporter permease n=1 Tax=Nocardioides sp. CFH 31398 TaxID=2919579 RepID=UPI001F05D953|nr:ABC transporter permease [Nocardioides sp. CFH 31398]MCH1866190.1 ABC transporter permease [Nocardioides sp. CFH 31398]